MEKNKDLHDKAWNLLEEKGLKLGERMMVRSAFVEWSGYKDEYPFIERKYKNGDVEFYHSSHEMIKPYMFKTEKEVILANAIYENIKEITNVNDFIQMFKYTCRIIGLKTEWS
jgi:hypothetical protein